MHTAAKRNGFENTRKQYIFPPQKAKQVAIRQARNENGITGFRSGFSRRCSDDDGDDDRAERWQRECAARGLHSIKCTSNR